MLLKKNKMIKQDLSERRSLRLKDYDYSSEGSYFVTICAQDKNKIFGNILNSEMTLNDNGNIALKCWNDLPNHYKNIKLDEFIIMPNHFHGIIIIDNDHNVGAIHESPLRNFNIDKKTYSKQRRNMLIPKMIGRFKMTSSKQINLLRNTPTSSVWQRSFYDRIIRNEKELNETREYIINNPIKWELDKYYNNCRGDS